MPSKQQLLVRKHLNEAGPLSIAELLARIPASDLPSSRDRNATITSAVRGDELIAGRGDGRYVFLPNYLAGAAVRVPVPFGSAPSGLIIGIEACTLLLASTKEQPHVSPTLVLEDGATVGATLDLPRGTLGGVWQGRAGILYPEPGFWLWWKRRQRQGADAVVIRCDDYHAKRFQVTAVRAESLGLAAVFAANVRLLTAAQAALSQNDGLLPAELARRLLARGVYHAGPAPNPLFPYLLSPETRILVEIGHRVSYRPELTAGVRRLLADRIERERQGGRFRDVFAHLSEELLGGARLPDDITDMFGGLRSRARNLSDDLPAVAPPRLVPHARRCYRMKIWYAPDKKVSRIVEFLDNHTLEDVHQLIQDSFGWYGMHLYSFYLSGRIGDELTEIEGLYETEDPRPPTTDQVFLADLELEVGRRIAYRYNFTDDWDHMLEVQDVTPAPAGGEFPRVVESRGYPSQMRLKERLRQQGKLVLADE